MNGRVLSYVCAVLVAGFTVDPSTVGAADLVSRQTGIGRVVGYKDTPPLPWTGGKYCVHDPDRPVPKVVVPRPVGSTLTPAPAPSDAIVLFDGKDTSDWKASEWEVKDGTLHAGHGSLETKQPFGDCQLHLEFATPREASQRFMNRGNSGVIFMKKYELQTPLRMLPFAMSSRVFSSGFIAG